MQMLMRKDEKRGYDAQVFVITDWSNLIHRKFTVTESRYISVRKRGNAALASAQSFCVQMLMKYSGRFPWDEITKIK